MQRFDSAEKGGRRQQGTWKAVGLRGATTLAQRTAARPPRALGRPIVGRLARGPGKNRPRMFVRLLFGFHALVANPRRRQRLQGHPSRSGIPGPPSPPLPNQLQQPQRFKRLRGNLFSATRSVSGPKSLAGSVATARSPRRRVMRACSSILTVVRDRRRPEKRAARRKGPCETARSGASDNRSRPPP